MWASATPMAVSANSGSLLLQMGSTLSTLSLALTKTFTISNEDLIIDTLDVQGAGKRYLTCIQSLSTFYVKACLRSVS